MDNTDRLYQTMTTTMRGRIIPRFSDFDGIEEVEKTYCSYKARRREFRSSVATAIAGGAMLIVSFHMPDSMAGPVTGAAGVALAIAGSADAATYRRKMGLYHTSLTKISDRLAQKIADTDNASLLERSVGTPGGPASVIVTDGDISATYPGTIGGTYDG
ncbi:TPA: hypothetical protein HA251_03325 [Candidatus Woesearchaeota archaeon]|nr:hypothetical protein [Candidatus Woesearchaeota archaeon]